VGLCQQKDFPVARLELLVDPRWNALAERVVNDIAEVSPKTKVVCHEMSFRDPWDFQEMYSKLYDFVSAYEFAVEKADYFVHLSTGTHVAQICWFLLTEANYAPARLVQTAPRGDPGLKTPEDRAGLPDWLLAAALQAGEECGHPGKPVITLSRSSVEPFLQFSTNRALREQAFAAFSGRGETGGATDNRAVIAEILALRAERARLLGYQTFADYRLDATMAKTPDAVNALLERVWSRAVLRA
jgi:hypothetical protein